MRQKLRLLVLGLGLATAARGQTVPVSGAVVSGAGRGDPLVGVVVQAIRQPDSTLRRGVATDTAGHFVLHLGPGSYRLRATFVGYRPLDLPLRVDSQAVTLGALKLFEDARQLRGVTIVGQQVRVENKGDTIQYNAGAFKTNPDANAQDLLTKMPGITVENGSVKAHGEDVKRVFIDGKPFFGDDPSLALRNLPAEIIDKIQVYDRMSDQAQFTGFDDGNTDKTINIITKPGKNNGQFGRVYAGGGTDRDGGDGRYSAGGTVNFFDGNRRISLLGLSNNINLQNFSTQDLLGALGGGGGGQRGGGGGRPGGGGPGGSGGGGGGGGPGGQGGANPTSNFLVGSQGGITATNALGLNFSDSWGKKLTVSGSYFFNNTSNQTNTLLNRTYFATRGQSQLYDETEGVTTTNLNHRLNARLEYKLNARNSFVLTPQASWQNTNATDGFTGENRLTEGALLSRTTSQNNTRNHGYSFSNTALWQHRFAKQGRTVSLGVTTSFNNRVRDNQLNSLNEFFAVRDSTFRLKQQSNAPTTGTTVSANLSYTEPVGKIGQVQLSYSPSLTTGQTDKKTYNVNGTTAIDSVLSNTFASRYLSQRTGFSYRTRGKTLQLMAGLYYQTATLTGDQSFPRTFTVRKTFDNLLPTAMLTLRSSARQNLRLIYRTSTNFPSVNQLQNVIDNSNPLQLSTGNPDLKQEYNHVLTLRFNRNNPQKATSFFAFLTATTTAANITNTTYLARHDTVVANGVVLYAGSQLTRPVNLDGARSIRLFVTEGVPVKALKSNLNFNAGYSYGRTPGLINNALNLNNTSTFTGGFVLSSSASEKFDFTLSYSGNYNVVRNSIRPQSNANYFYHTASARVNWLFGHGFLVNTDLTHTLYQGLGAAFDQHFLLWNLSLGKKFGKGRLNELKLTVFDVLRQNNSISRTVTQTYVDDTRTQVLRQYGLLTFTHTFRNFIR